MSEETIEDLMEGISVRDWLEDFRFKLEVESPKHDYRFEYTTSSLKDPKTGKAQLKRTYRLKDLVRGSSVQQPWDEFDLDKQAELVSGLLEISGYRIVKLIVGWKVECPECGNVMKGEIWEVRPRVCRAKGCKQEIAPEDIQELAHTNA